MKDIFIHVGYPKTSTTWIQECFFSEHPDLYYLGTTLKKPANKDITTPRVWWLSKLANVHSNDFDSEYFRNEADKTMSEEKLNCISYEGFIGDPLNNWFIPEVRANRIAAVFPNAKILITLREQLSLLASMYGEYLKAGGTYPVNKLIDWEEGQVGRQEAFVLSQLKYDKVVQNYYNLFGKNNVLVLLYEEFLWDRMVYLETICQFAGIGSLIPDADLYRRRNAGLRHPVTLNLLRIANKSFKSDLHPYNFIPRRGLYRALRIFDSIALRVGSAKQDGKNNILKGLEVRLLDCYRSSNERLQEITEKKIRDFWQR